MYNSGVGLHSCEKLNWKTSVEWYKKVIQSLDDSEDDVNDNSSTTHTLTDEPVYLVLEQIAKLYRYGGNELEKNLSEAYHFYNEAAELAMVHGNGRLSTKYYMLAETISAETE
jgi:elongation factor 2 kinase